MLKIAVAGAPSTGKHLLVSALDHALKDAGRNASVAVANACAISGNRAGYGLVLLCGLESMEPSQHAADQSIRSALAAAGMAYCVLYGGAPQRLGQALAAVERLQPGLPLREEQPASRSRPWVWVCDKCSDPVCEHRLLSDLLAQRGSPALP
ncbi:hypothetical protein [Polaromonas sp. YR568]|uniref:hypothetical protein n=1 Tax=Polaromonas sp. YR568 TaxID=1855301 RepID=UPI00398BFAF1